MEAKLRQEIVKTINNDLLEMGSTGKADELIQLTTKVVTNAKRLLIEGIPEPTVAKITASLTKLVLAAKSIAQNPTAPNFAEKIKHLSEVRRLVDNSVKELDEFISTLTPIARIAPTVVVEAPSVTAAVQTSDKEKRLLNELMSQYRTFSAKKEVQKNLPDTREKPEDAMKIIVAGIGRSVSEIEKLLESPVKESLLDPICLLCKMINKLLDIEDSLFINKFPMRTQVFEFTDVIVSTTIKSKKDSRNWIDQTSVKTLKTQIRALLQAVEVVIEQCYKRVQTLEQSWHQSIKRKKELDELHPSKSPSKSPSPEPKSSEQPEKPTSTATFIFSCVICTNTAFDADSDSLIPRGKDLTFRVPLDITVKKLKHKISLRTSIPVSELQLCQGQDPLSDSHMIPLASTIPYFLFNINEPSEEESKEMQRQQRKQKNVRIEDINWSLYAYPIAVALYDYDTEDRLGEDGNLSFYEGEIIEITEKSHDGWWEGRIHGQSGVFPASFVLELQKPGEEKPSHAALAHRGSVQVEAKPLIDLTENTVENHESHEEVHPEPDATGRSRVSSFTAGFKRPFRKKNKDSPKTSPKTSPKNSPVTGHRPVEGTVSSPLMKSTSDKPPETKQPTTAPKPRRPPPPVPPAPYRKKTAHYVKLEEPSSPESETVTKDEGQNETQTMDDSEQMPSLYEVPISQHSTLQTISEVDNLPPKRPVAPPRRRKREGLSPKLPAAKPHLGRIPKVPSAPVLHILQSNGDSPIAKRKTSDVVVSVHTPSYTEAELAKCTGVGKSGNLFIDESGRWYERIFKLERDRLVYQDRGGLVIIGEVLLSAMECVTEMNEKQGGYHCIAIHLKEESSIVLGATNLEDKHDWAVSINKAVDKRTAVITEINDHLSTSPAYLVAMECISFLMKDGHSETDKIFRIPGNVGKLKKYLDVIDSYKKPSLDDMPNPNTAASLLKSMFKNERIDVLVPSDIVTNMCIHVQRNGPVSRMRDLCLSIPEDKRTLLAALIQLFSQIVKHSDKNHTDISTLNKMFGECLFEQCPSGNAESLLTYIVKTKDAVLS